MNDIVRPEHKGPVSTAFKVMLAGATDPEAEALRSTMGGSSQLAIAASGHPLASATETARTRDHVWLRKEEAITLPILFMLKPPARFA